MISGVSQLFKEDNGMWSSARLIAIAWSLGELAVWMYLSIHQATMVDVPTSAQTALGIAVGGKILQKFGERVAEPPRP